MDIALYIFLAVVLIRTIYNGVNSHAAQRYADTRAISAHRLLNARILAAKFFQHLIWN